MIIKLENNVYDVLKWLVMIVIPAATAAYVGLATIWGWPFADQVAQTSAVLCTFLGAILGISNLQYKSENQEAIENEGVQRD